MQSIMNDQYTRSKLWENNLGLLDHSDWAGHANTTLVRMGQHGLIYLRFRMYTLESALGTSHLSEEHHLIDLVFTKLRAKRNILIAM